MLVKLLIKNPIFAIGVILFGLFIYDLYDRKPGLFTKSRTVTSCKAVLKPLFSKSPDKWDFTCEENNLVLLVKSEVSPKSPSLLKGILYREIANHMTFIAKNAPHETLERVFKVKVRLEHPLLTIESLSDGKDLAKLATITNERFMAEHMRATVEVIEFAPSKR